jgi:GNAT superfamily N-acetyltransferase
MEPETRLIELTNDSAAAVVNDARELLLDYGRFLLGQLGPAQVCFGSLEKEAAELPEIYLSQGGGCIVAYFGNIAAGFVAWRELKKEIAPDAWEMKRLWVDTVARGHSIGRILTMAVLDRARAAGRTAIYLDTVPAQMSNAHRLYLDLGFKPCAPYNSNPTEGITHLRILL